MKEITHLSIENQELIYKLLEQNCDLIFTGEQEKPEDYLFCSKEKFNIFATNGGGDVYGFIEGIGDLQHDNYPIGYVCHEGKCSRIASNLKELLQLVVFYPYWYDLLNYSPENMSVAMKELEKEVVNMKQNYYENQQTIAHILNIKRDEKSITNLFNNLRENQFIVLGNDEDGNRYESLL